MSWEALSHVLETTHAAYLRWRADQHIEMLWSGPSPADQIPARRIDQALYDLIIGAKREILLVTFAAGKVERLAAELLKAIQRGVKVRLILEFEQSSEGQLSYDALKAFPAALVSGSEVYHWPTEKRERNHAGKPGKLHAKVAIVDDVAVVSSANLTDDAFTRNFEIGALVFTKSFQEKIQEHLDGLITEGTLTRISN
ncbi:MAG: Cardiolipin synthase A [Anaerolineae bacterium]|nr:Cardiolipin synthase A [Anaerolineae bacterium]